MIVIFLISRSVWSTQTLVLPVDEILLVRLLHQDRVGAVQFHQLFQNTARPVPDGGGPAGVRSTGPQGRYVQLSRFSISAVHWFIKRMYVLSIGAPYWIIKGLNVLSIGFCP